jgi:hypothetical protein
MVYDTECARGGTEQNPNLKIRHYDDQPGAYGVNRNVNSNSRAKKQSEKRREILRCTGRRVRRKRTRKQRRRPVPLRMTDWGRSAQEVKNEGAGKAEAKAVATTESKERV